MATANDQRFQPGRQDPVRHLQRMAGDARLAAVFKQIRAIVGVSEMEMARRLGTDVAIILDFEAGAVDALPPWPVTARLIERYAAMAEVDPKPILTHLLALQAPAIAPVPYAPRVTAANAYAAPYAEPAPYEPAAYAEPASYAEPVRYAAPAPVYGNAQPHAYDQAATSGRATAQPTARAQVLPPERSPQMATPATPAEIVDADHLGFTARSKLRTGRPDAVRTQAQDTAPDSDVEAGNALRRRRRLRRSLLAASPFLFVLTIFAMVQFLPKPVYATTRLLPGVIGSSARGLVDAMVLQTATFKDGLRWIDPADPRVRKGHRLN